MLACVVLISSEIVKEIYESGNRVISLFADVLFICKFPNLKVESFRDEIPISGFDSLVPSW